MILGLAGFLPFTLHTSQRDGSAVCPRGRDFRWASMTLRRQDRGNGLKSKAAALLLAAPLSFPSAAHAEAGFSAPVAVASVNARDVGTDVYVPGFSNPFPCANAQFFRIQNDIPNGDMMRATLLTAFAAARPVKVWVNGCAPDGVSTVLAVWAAP